mmetsp:Transcript_6165/g.15064  ORF Transcript_6165/g.15064 Transcript_6165/m.15064 type:complete len:155 (+) Transcript_6165:101-565(+)
MNACNWNVRFQTLTNNPKFMGKFAPQTVLTDKYPFQPFIQQGFKSRFKARQDRLLQRRIRPHTHTLFMWFKVSIELRKIKIQIFNFDPHHASTFTQIVTLAIICDDARGIWQECGHLQLEELLITGSNISGTRRTQRGCNQKRRTQARQRRGRR